MPLEHGSFEECGTILPACPRSCARVSPSRTGASTKFTESISETGTVRYCAGKLGNWLIDLKVFSFANA
jgi:hypothetical protein